MDIIAIILLAVMAVLSCIAQIYLNTLAKKNRRLADENAALKFLLRQFVSTDSYVEPDFTNIDTHKDIEK